MKSISKPPPPLLAPIKKESHSHKIIWIYVHNIEMITVILTAVTEQNKTKIVRSLVLVLEKYIIA